jgi:hypothetical protein
MKKKTIILYTGLYYLIKMCVHTVCQCLNETINYGFEIIRNSYLMDLLKKKIVPTKKTFNSLFQILLSIVN